MVERIEPDKESLLCPTAKRTLSKDFPSSLEPIVDKGLRTFQGESNCITSPDTLNLLRKCTFISLSFIFSIGINLYTTFFFSKQRYNFGLPLLAATLSDWTQMILSVLTLMLIEWREGPGVLGSFRLLSKRQFLRFILPCGVAAALNIALSNSSLRHVSLSFYTMVKSCAPVFVLLFTIAFGLEKPSPFLLGIVTIILFGVVLTVWNAFSFSIIGFLLVFGASILSGLRWTLTQLIIEYSSVDELSETSPIAESGPLRTMVYLAPVVGISLLILSLLFEGPRVIWNFPSFSTFSSTVETVGICVFGGLQAFIVILLEYKVVQETSVLTFSITGVIKELLIIGISVAVFGDQLKLVNIVGALLTIVGLMLYNIYKVNYKGIVRSDEMEVDLEEKKRRRVNDAALQNMFMAVPTTEPSWIFDPRSNSPEPFTLDGHFWSFAPQPTPLHSPLKSIRQQQSLHRRSSLKEFRVENFEALSESFRSTRTASPTRKSIQDFNETII